MAPDHKDGRKCMRASIGIYTEFMAQLRVMKNGRAVVPIPRTNYPQDDPPAVPPVTTIPKKRQCGGRQRAGKRIKMVDEVTTGSISCI